MNPFKTMSADFLRQTYVPDVYQPSIYAIDYQKLWDVGIRFLSFDIDDTIADLIVPTPSREAKALFGRLKVMGFDVWLLSNTSSVDRAKHFAEELGIPGKYIPRAGKPRITHFVQMQEKFGLEKSQMAHIGNSMMEDIAGGNVFGVVTCLVRRAGVVGGIPKRIPGVITTGQKLRKVLKKRGIWRKHHKYCEKDQYYQLGETPKYRVREQGDAYADAMRSSEKAYLKSLKDSCK